MAEEEASWEVEEESTMAAGVESWAVVVNCSSKQVGVVNCSSEQVGVVRTREEEVGESLVVAVGVMDVHNTPALVVVAMVGEERAVLIDVNENGGRVTSNWRKVELLLKIYHDNFWKRIKNLHA